MAARCAIAELTESFIFFDMPQPFGRTAWADLRPTGPPLADAVSSLSLVREVCPPGARYGPQTLHALAVFLTQQGEASVSAGGKILRHRPGSLVLLNAGLTIRETVGESQSWTVHYMLIEGAWAQAVGTRLEKRGGRGAAVYAPAPGRWQRQFSAILDAGLGQADGWEWTFLSGWAALCGEIARSPASSDGADGLLDEMEQLLDDSPEQAASATALARTLGLSVRQLDHRMEKITGKSAAQWVRERRMGRAQRLLAAGCSVTQTAELLGFANPYHFSRAFKAATGMTPSEARSRAAPGGLHAESV